MLCPSSLQIPQRLGLLAGGSLGSAGVVVVELAVVVLLELLVLELVVMVVVVLELVVMVVVVLEFTEAVELTAEGSSTLGLGQVTSLDSSG